MAKILVVDDEQVMRDLFTRVLKLKDHEVVTVTDGNTAIEIVKKDSFDIVFLDIVMPEMDGLETYKKMKEVKPDVVAVMMTAYAVEEKVREALSLGAFDYLYKPFDVVEIMTIIDKVAKREKLKPLEGGGK